MSPIETLHEEAMELAELADIAKLRGDSGEQKLWLGRALAKAVAAADGIAPHLESEPTRSILHRSAASLAVEMGEFAMAERLIAVALAGSPPPAIGEELKDLFVQINLTSYFARRGLWLDMDQWVLSQAS
jgi:hypothetical protein